MTPLHREGSRLVLHLKRSLLKFRSLLREQAIPLKYTLIDSLTISGGTESRRRNKSPKKLEPANRKPDRRKSQMFFSPSPRKMTKPKVSAEIKTTGFVCRRSDEASGQLWVWVRPLDEEMESNDGKCFLDRTHNTEPHPSQPHWSDCQRCCEISPHTIKRFLKPLN